jgi:hypothetical protein
VEEPQKVGQPSLAKVGGILVQCSGDGKEYFLVVGKLTCFQAGRVTKAQTKALG